MPDLELFFIALGLFFGAYELHQNRKSQYLQIYQESQRRYDDLNEDRKEFHFYYTQSDFSLLRLKKEKHEDYKKIIHWETRYFWFYFYEWLEGHVRKSIPTYLRRDWDYAIKAAMKNPVHKQAWQEEIGKIDFLGYREFNKFIDDCTRNRR